MARFMYPRTRAKLKAFLHERQGGKCCYCGILTEMYPQSWGVGNPAPANFATLEHLKRVADGGTNDPDNVAIACWKCNNERDILGVSWVEFKTMRQPMPALAN